MVSVAKVFRSLRFARVMPPRRVRKNGLERPYSGSQVVTWVLLPILLILFYLFITPVVSKTEAAVSGVLYSILMVVACAAAYKTCSVDPMDPLLKVSRRLRSLVM